MRARCDAPGPFPFPGDGLAGARERDTPEAAAICPMPRSAVMYLPVAPSGRESEKPPEPQAETNPLLLSQNGSPFRCVEEREADPLR